MQDLDDSLLRALVVAQHQAGQRGWPFYLIGAGLPHLPGVLAEARSYAERLFDYRAISRLADPEATAALVDPVEPHGVTVADEAIAIFLDASGGYPYFLQEYGRAAWESSAGPVITEDDALSGAQLRQIVVVRSGCSASSARPRTRGRPVVRSALTAARPQGAPTPRSRCGGWRRSPR